MCIDPAHAVSLHAPVLRQYSVAMMPSKPADTAHPWGNSATPYEEIGGEVAVRELAETFYDVIEAESPGLRSLLPTNTRNTRQKFFMYLSGWLGGPSLYEEKWGHPQLRMRHSPFPIGETEAAEWMRCMRKAMTETGIGEPLRTFL
jgi:hemoglobin